eukprot:728164-Pelagomonas_calceolata.AAC.7
MTRNALGAKGPITISTQSDALDVTKKTSPPFFPYPQAMEKEVLHGTCNRSSAVCPPFTTAGIGFAPGVVPSASYIHPPLHQHQPALAHPAAITPTTAIASEAIACPPLPPFLTNPPEDYVQDSEVRCALLYERQG